MNDASIKNFCIWARNELRDQVHQRLIEWQISEDAELDLAVVGTRPLSTNEREQRRELMTLIKDLGEEGLVERAAYTWFNRFMAIRYMEVNGFLPSGARFLSDAEGEFHPQVIADASSAGIEGIDEQTVFELIQNADDEELFRYLFLAQCNELADCMPDVFEPIGSAMELLLPKGLLRQGSVIERMVTDIPEDTWREGVQIVGWMYQYYNAERKDEVFASFKKGKKADAAFLAPATQLFTPDWIVRYLVENSLGRLWMRSHPDSKLVDQMAYYISDEETVDTPSVVSPESITVVDPACGSGHILVYAFDLLAAIYEEAGYVPREIPQLILQKNLAGIEIDPRAGAMASFMLTMKGCERDSRFLARRVYPNITVLAPVHMEEEELALVPDLADRAKLLDAMEHADECGSLFVPDETDINAIDGALDKLRESGCLFAGSAREKLEHMKASCEPLARAYDVVVANPPYMGSSNMDKWLADWTKRNYPDSKRDLCTCFIERGFTLARGNGYIGMITASSWMFISSFESFRKQLLDRGSIIAMVQQSTHGYAGVTVPTCMFSYQIGAASRIGTYIRLEDFDRPQLQKPKTEEAIANPDCGWFYRRDADAFSAIPGSPIAYWLGDGALKAFRINDKFQNIGCPKVGMQTSNNDKYLRRWWEVDRLDVANVSGIKWIKYLKGGDFRRWYGNLEWLLFYNYDSGFITRQPHARVLSLEYLDIEKCTWTMLTSGPVSFRIAPKDTFYDISGHCFFPDIFSSSVLLGWANCSVSQLLIRAMNPTMNLQVSDIGNLPFPNLSEVDESLVDALGITNIEYSKIDWDSFETSWDFQRHPMV